MKTSPLGLRMHELLPAEGGGSRRGQIAGLCIALLLVVASFRTYWIPPSPGLDASWVWAINTAGPATFAFGEAVVWTWGPLGYLLFTEGVKENLHASAWAAFALSSLMLVPVLWRVARGCPPWQMATFALAYLLAIACGALPEHVPVFVMVMWTGLALTEGWMPAVAVLSAMAAVGLFVKLSLGVIGYALLALTGLTLAMQRRRGWFVWGLVCLFINVALLAVLGSALFATSADFVRWLHGSQQIVAGYDEAVSLSGAASERNVALLLMAANAVAWAVLRLNRAPLAALMAACSFVVFAFFKHGFVRHDPPHFISFAVAMLGLSAIWLLFARAREERWCSGSVLSVTLIGLLSVHGGRPLLRAEVADGITGRTAVGMLAAALHPARTTAEHTTASAECLAPLRLPESFLSTVGGGRLMPLPYELNYCAANPVTCVPPATLLLYSTFTPWLDAWNAERIGPSLPPTHLLVEYFSIDSHHMLWDAPLMWQRILARYEIAERSDHLLLLRPRAQPHDEVLQPYVPRRTEPPVPAPSAQTTVPTPVQSLPFNIWAPVPPSDRLLFAHIHFNKSLLGRLRAFAYRLPEVALELRYADGRPDLRRRIVRNVAASGVLVNDLPGDLDALAGLLGGHTPNQATHMRVVVERDLTHYFEPDVQLSWAQSSWALAPR